MLPAGGEIGVEVGIRRLEEQTGVDGARTTDGATDESVRLGATGQVGRGGKDGVVQPRDVDAAQVGAGQPLRPLGTPRDAVGWTASLEEKNFLSGLTQPTGNDDSCGTGADHNHIPYRRRP